ncbi:MAG TPA: hypothetical protein VLF41_03805 [Candidatus Nanoarchaeia archaeon]|nr:hypothetical protein [Candidatus Nanoarchaeia archaeon]
MSSSDQRGNVPVIEILILVGLVAVGGAVYYNSRQKATPNPAPVVVQKKAADTTKPAPPADPYAGWALVTDSKYGVTIKVPPSWSRNLVDDSNGFSLTVTADDAAKSKGTVTIMTDDFGHGTPGPVASQTKVTIAGQSADKTVWQGGGTELVEYKFQKSGKYYKFELTAPSTNTTLFDQFDLVVKSFTLS